MFLVTAWGVALVYALLQWIGASHTPSAKPKGPGAATIVPARFIVEIHMRRMGTSTGLEAV